MTTAASPDAFEPLPADEAEPGEEPWTRPEIEFLIPERDQLARMDRKIARANEAYTTEVRDADLMIPRGHANKVPLLQLQSSRIYLLDLVEGIPIQQQQLGGQVPSLPKWAEAIEKVSRTEDVNQPTVREKDGHQWVDLPLSFRDDLIEMQRELRLLVKERKVLWDGLREKYNADEVGLALVEWYDDSNGRIYYLTAKENSDRAHAMADKRPYNPPPDILKRMGEARGRSKGKRQ